MHLVAIYAVFKAATYGDAVLPCSAYLLSKVDFFNHKIPDCGSLKTKLSLSLYLDCSSSDAVETM